MERHLKEEKQQMGSGARASLNQEQQEQRPWDGFMLVMFQKNTRKPGAWRGVREGKVGAEDDVGRWQGSDHGGAGGPRATDRI